MLELCNNKPTNCHLSTFFYQNLGSHPLAINKVKDYAKNRAVEFTDPNIKVKLPIQQLWLSPFVREWKMQCIMGNGFVLLQGNDSNEGIQQETPQQY